jgi:hypothetical protein
MMGMPMQTLLLVAPAAAASNLTIENWDAISKAPDRSTIHDLIRKIRGEVSSSKNAMVITWKRDGTLVARKLDEQVPFGFLTIDETLDVVGKQAIERILQAVGIVRE